MNDNTTPETPQDAAAVGAQLVRNVRPLVEKLRERRQATAWSRGQDTDYPTRWEPDALCQQAANEIDRLHAALKQANDQAEHFERLWYLTNEDAARYAFAKTLEGQVVTMETLKVRGAAELDQAIDDAMMEAADAQNEAGYGA